MTRHTHHLTGTIVLTLAAGHALATTTPTVTYEHIPAPAMTAYDMSPDGRFVVGDIDANADLVADGTYRWDRLTGEFLTLPSDGLTAAAVSDDGQVVLGDVPNPVTGDPISGVEAGMWTPGGGWQNLGALPNAGECPSSSDGYELSADGSIAVGLSWDLCSGRGFVWDAVNGMRELAALANGANRASVVSADGTIVAGFAQGTFSRTPAIWDAVSLVGETVDPAGNLQGEFTGIADDGSVLLGTAYMGGADGNYDAVRWTSAGGMQVIGNGSILDGWASNAMDIADDGTIIGFDLLLGNRRAWIQPQGQGNLQLLSAWAESNGATVDDDLLVPQAISADGRVICGFGLTTTQFVGWIITVTPPCPADIDGNGALNLDDVNLFAGAFVNGDLLADVDGNGVLNLDDVNTFAASFVAGCP